MPSKRQKGQAFEREVCRDLSRWVSDGKQIDLFWRSAMSGGRATRHGLAVRQAGDITAVASEGHILTDNCYIECKFYKDLNLRLFLLGGGGPLALFWRDTIRKAEAYKRVPLLIAKENNATVLAITEPDGRLDKAVQKLRNGFDSIYVDMQAVGVSCVIFRFADLLETDFSKIGMVLHAPTSRPRPTSTRR